jgi:hypothetical protein
VQAWLILLVIPGILLWCHVPGFLPPATLDPATGDYISFFVRFSHPFIGRSNNLAALLLLVVPPTVAWALRTRRWLDIAVAAVGEVALMLTISRGAFVGLAAGVAFYFILERRARRAVLTSLLWSLPSLGLAILIAAVNPTTQQYVGSRLNDDNVVARLELLNKARESLSGAGSSGLPAWLTGAGGGIGVDVHNTFVQQILSFGLLFGVVICLALILTGTWWYRRNNLHSRPAAPIFGIGVVAVLISFLFESSFEGSLLRPLIWLGWGMLVVGALRPSVRTLPWTAVFPRKWVRKPGEPARR